MSKLKAVLFDKVKGKEAVYEDDYPYGADNALYQWLEGNYACDDNRGQFVAEVLGEPDPEYPCGDDKVELRALYLDGQLIGQDEVSELVATDNQSQVEPLKSAQSDPKRKANT